MPSPTYVDCDNFGHVIEFPFWSSLALNALDIQPEIAHVTMQPSTAAAMMMMMRSGGGGDGGASKDMTSMATAESSTSCGGA